MFRDHGTISAGKEGELQQGGYHNKGIYPYQSEQQTKKKKRVTGVEQHINSIGVITRVQKKGGEWKFQQNRAIGLHANDIQTERHWKKVVVGDMFCRHRGQNRSPFRLDHKVGEMNMGEQKRVGGSR